MRMNKRTASTVLVIYVLLLLGAAVISRTTIISKPQLTLFWSYRAWFEGNRSIGCQIIANIAVFVPFGVLAHDVFERRSLPAAVIISMVVSLLIESLQLYLHRGLFEFDDLLNNTLGGIIGWIIYRHLRTVLPQWVWFAGIIAASVGLIAAGRDALEEPPNLPRDCCIQIDDVQSGEISGFAFLCNRDSKALKIKLRSGTGKILSCQTEYGIPREDVNRYFCSDRDYTKVGFRAACDGMTPGEEYEIIADFGWLMSFNTGVYATDDRVHFVKDAESAETEGLEELLGEGMLLVSRPDYHCRVYQAGEELYWVVDIGGYFEDYEIKGDFGRYRVMRREIPKEYAVTSIVTGYHKSGKWVWKSYFRPLYEIA